MDRLGALDLIQAVREDRHRGNERSRLARLARTADVVYYIQFRDLIKIGTTVALDTRLSTLPWELLLGLEPGGRDVEAARHHQFRTSRYQDEWFEITTDLTNHVQQIAETNAEWMVERFPGLTLPYEYHGRYRHRTNPLPADTPNAGT